MIIAVTSDLHFGHGDKTVKYLNKFLENVFCENPDIIIIAGDLISNKQPQMPKLFKILREWFISTPILVVLGNHDFYDYFSKSRARFHRRLAYGEMRNDHRKYFKKFNIHYLSDNPFVKDGVAIFGFDGYYKKIPPDTNDPINMPTTARDVPIHTYLNWKAHKKLDKILLDVEEYKEHKKICVTHFPPYSKQPSYAFMAGNFSYLDFIVEKFGHLIVGHSHQREDWTYRNCRIINPGSDYDKPKYTLISL